MVDKAEDNNISDLKQETIKITPKLKRSQMVVDHKGLEVPGIQEIMGARKTIKPGMVQDILVAPVDGEVQEALETLEDLVVRVGRAALADLEILALQEDQETLDIREVLEDLGVLEDLVVRVAGVVQADLEILELQVDQETLDIREVQADLGPLGIQEHQEVAVQAAMKILEVLQDLEIPVIQGVLVAPGALVDGEDLEVQVDLVEQVDLVVGEIQEVVEAGDDKTLIEFSTY
ncbi:uncharacterized protein [Atheta coriaria]|uniref:uncharacterized protein n=1 Tax=Dalotia coriaria TaxID=877792 RepID=UPI0031F44548